LHFEISGLVLTFFLLTELVPIQSVGRIIGLFIFEAWGGLPASGKGSKDLV
jgi:hypothetical protein